MGLYAHVPPYPTSAPAILIVGTMSIGQVLTAVASGVPTPTLQWFRDGVAIAAAIAATYTLVAADIGPAITCVATNAYGTATSNTLRYDPATDPNVIEAFDPGSLANGAVANWVGVKNVVVLSQATAGLQPTKAAASLNGTPGVAFNGGTVLATTALASIYALKTGMTLAYAAQDASVATEAVFETDGGIGGTGISMITNDSGGAGNYEGLISAVGWKSAVGDFAAAVYASNGYDRTIDRGVSYLRQLGVSLGLTNRGGAVTPGGNFAFTTMFVGGRGAVPALGYTGTLGWIIFGNGLLTAGSNALATIEAFTKYKTAL